MPNPPDGSIRPASTILLLADGPAAPRVLLVRRHDRVAFMAGAHVFPGGRVDDTDYAVVACGACDGLDQAAASLPDLPGRDSAAHHVAAIRELFEEAGVLMARDAAGHFVSFERPDVRGRFERHRLDLLADRATLADIATREGLRLALDVLAPWARWVTPPTETRRYDTRFFAAPAPAGQTASHEQPEERDGETTESVWMTAADAVASAERGEIRLPPPTWTTLRELEPFASVDTAIAWARRRRVTRREPRLIEKDGQRTILLPGDPQYPDPSGEPAPRETRFVIVDGRWRPAPDRA